ncbi:hypothetical protein HDU67_001800 [Dinochytrium kinnereticum]|nr:hypothetical protein HDU67_001800 [Dinochytrium kinnereticum]
MMSLHEVETQLKASLQSQQSQQINPIANHHYMNGHSSNPAATSIPHPYLMQHQQQLQQQVQQQPATQQLAPHDVLASHLYHNGFVQGMYSDLHLRIQVVQNQQGNGMMPGGPLNYASSPNLQVLDGAVFKLHKLIALRSPMLASLMQDAEMRGENYGNPTELILAVADPNLTTDGLTIAFGHLYASYTHNILSSGHSGNRNQRTLLLRGVLAAANLLHLGDLANLATEMIRNDVCRATVIDYCLFASQSDFGGSYGSWSADVRDAVFSYLSRGMVRELAERGPIWGNKESEQYKELVGAFAELPFDWLKKVVESKDSFEVPSDMERFGFAKDVIALRARSKGAGSNLLAGEENVLLAFGTSKAGQSGVTIVRKAPKMNPHQLQSPNASSQSPPSLYHPSSGGASNQNQSQSQQGDMAGMGMNGRMNGYGQERRKNEILSAMFRFHRQLLNRALQLSSRTFTSIINRTSSLLPTSFSSAATATPLSNGMIQRSNLLQRLTVRTYKTKSSLKLRCEHCFFAKRRGKLRVICKENPKHKQVQI